LMVLDLAIVRGKSTRVKQNLYRFHRLTNKFNHHARGSQS
jgi:hypothetical protein